MCEEYNPSRRRKAPRSPFGLASYSRSALALYSAVNRRRRAFSKTSGSDFAVPFVEYPFGLPRQ
jgi:hypothetical protein